MACQTCQQAAQPRHLGKDLTDLQAPPSLGSFEGRASGTASGHHHDLLGLPGTVSMPPGFPEPRINPSRTNYMTSGLGDFGSEIIPTDSEITLETSISDNTRTNWPSSHTVQRPDTGVGRTNALPLQRFTSEKCDPFNTVRLAGPLNTNNCKQQISGHQQHQSSLSTQSHSDEGYFTQPARSQQDAGSVISGRTASVTRSAHTSQIVPRSFPSSCHQAGQLFDPSMGAYNIMNYGQFESYQVVPGDSSIESFICEKIDCGWKGKTQSEFKKHEARHERKFRCTESGCPKVDKGFATINDLERHQKTVHKLQPTHGHSREYKCFASGCARHEKEWPRLDNFKQHLVRMHKHEDTDVLVKRSDEWYEETKSTRTRLGPPTPIALSRSISVSGLTTNSAKTSSHSRGLAVDTSLWTPSKSSGLLQPAGTSLVANDNFLYSTPIMTQFNGVGQCHSPASHQMNRSPSSHSRISQTSLAGPSSGCAGPNSSSTQELQAPSRSRSSLTPYAAQNLNRGLPASSEHMHGYEANLNMNIRVRNPDIQQGGMQRSSSSILSQQYPRQTHLNPRAINFGARTAPEPCLHDRSTDIDDYPVTQSSELAFVADTGEDLLAQMTSNPVFDDILNLSLNQSSNLPTTGQDHVNNELQNLPRLSTKAIADVLREHASQVSGRQLPDLSTPAGIQRIFRAGLQSLHGSSSMTTGSSDAVTGVHGSNNKIEAISKNGTMVYPCTDRGCSKTMARRCDLKKHIKRHQRPYGCTFDNCYKSFGSKNDWKRHECKQHAQQECWRCDWALESSSVTAIRRSPGHRCLKLFYTRDIYSSHLRDLHGVREEQISKSLIRNQRIGKGCQNQYWCGFCDQIVVMKKKGVEGSDERFNHIDNHFSSEMRNINDWKPLEGTFSKNQDLGAGQNDTSEDDSNEEMGGADHSNPSIEPSTGVIWGRSKRAGSPSHEAAAPRTQRPRISQAFRQTDGAIEASRSPSLSGCQTRRRMIFCCHCQEGPWLVKNSAACIGCNHTYCSSCTLS